MAERIRYELFCPNPECSHQQQLGRPYHYYLEVFDEPEWERCPICGHFAPIKDFMKGVGNV